MPDRNAVDMTEIVEPSNGTTFGCCSVQPKFRIDRPDAISRQAYRSLRTAWSRWRCPT
jgi:hypothetical protein